MKIWLLRPVAGLSKDESPWEPRYYDTVDGFVVRAKDELAARHIADENAGNENRGGRYGDSILVQHPWLDAHYSTCEEIKQNGVAGLIMHDFHTS